PPTLPTEVEIAAVRARADYHRLAARLDPPALQKASPFVSVDFSSMAKGFAADSLSAILLALGAPDHFVQLGGDIKTAGHAAATWRTGIENPPTLPDTPSANGSSAPTSLAAVVALSGQSLSTSGDSRNFTLIAGRRYGHIIDPRTGRPAASTLASVSVIAGSCATSSALATALFVLGPDAGFAFATREHLAALFLIRDGEKLRQRATPAFESFRSPAPPGP
ncbi:MAG: FAD:protein FMN transferase, partial [Verrucomicrobia bacterium]|nr:FAD:protein FMN transferase [Verrucomicrobiota bacterium]